MEFSFLCLSKKSEITGDVIGLLSYKMPSKSDERKPQQKPPSRENERGNSIIYLICSKNPGHSESHAL